MGDAQETEWQQLRKSKQKWQQWVVGKKPPRHCDHLNDGYRQVVAWLSGSALISINEVTLRWARLVLG